MDVATRTEFATAIEQFEDVFSLLACAVRYSEPIDRPTFAWGDGEKEWNYAVIVRTPTGITGRAKPDPGFAEKLKQDALYEHLRSLDMMLRFGDRREERRTCVDEDGEEYEVVKRHMGGVRDLLGRDPVDSDQISLGILRDLAWLEDRQAPSDDYRINEWLSEVTLIAKPGA